MSDIKIVVAGAGGRMGRTLVRVISETQGCAVAGALEAATHPDLGKDAGVLAGLAPLGVALSADPSALLAAADVVVDFTTPKVSVALAEMAAEKHIVAVIGTTGFSAEDEARIRTASQKTAIVKSGNMSRGISLLAALVKQAAKALPDFDIEILEMHHAKKVDAPSGTALLLGEAAAAGRGIALGDAAVRGRDGMIGPRPSGAIGFASLRGGTVVGEHQVIFAGNGERLTLSHSAEDRTILASGAVAAVLWSQGKKPGLYSMVDVLGLS
jgi:4-hydroxy-tetrahydrodipicolinate reductase